MKWTRAYLREGKWQVYDAYLIKETIKAAGGRWFPEEKIWELGLEAGKRVLNDNIRMLDVRVGPIPDIVGQLPRGDITFATVADIKNGFVSIMGWDDGHHRVPIIEVLQKEGM
jgi:hypothetical protein